jgi:ribosome-associated protein
MEHRLITVALLGNEIEFQTSRSSGPGGQNVNKVNSKVTLRFNVRNSAVLTDEEKTILLNKLGTKLTTDGELIISSQDKRSQLENKESAVAKTDRLFQKAFEKKKKRKATKPSKSAVQKRLKSKKEHAEKKSNRRWKG